MLSARKRKGESSNPPTVCSKSPTVKRKHAHHSSDTSLLFSLPESVLKYLIEDYLTLQDIAELDSATCNDLDRDILHCVLRSAVLRDRVHLDFPSSNIDVDKLNWLSTRQMDLASVSILYSRDFFVSDEHSLASEALSLKWSVVKELELTDCFDFVDILQHCSSLEKLTLISRINVSGYMFLNDSLYVENLVEYFNKCATAFGLANTIKSISLSPEYSTDEAVASIVSNCPVLEVIRLGGISFSHETLSSIFSECRNLRAVSFNFRRFIRNCVRGEPLTRCFRPNASIIDLNLFDCYFDDAGLLAIAMCFPNLTHLHIGLTESVSKVGIGVITDSFQNLTSLALHDNAAHIHDFTLIDLLSKRSSLSEVRLKGFRALTAITFGDITQLLPTVHSLTHEDTNIKYDDHLDSSALFRMRGLVLRRESVTDEFLLSFTRACPLLEKLQLMKCYNVSDVGIYHIATHCRNLTTFSLYCLRDVSNAKYILQVFTNNRQLSRRNITLHELGMIRHSYLDGHSPEFYQIFRA